MAAYALIIANMHIVRSQKYFVVSTDTHVPFDSLCHIIIRDLMTQHNHKRFSTLIWMFTMAMGLNPPSWGQTRS